MSKLSFRARALDASKPMPIYMAEELPDLPDYSAINRAVPQMPSGMTKEEECEHHLQRAICTGLIIPTPEVTDLADAEAYDKIYPADYKLPRQLIHMQPFAMEQDIPDYDMDSEDEKWVGVQSRKMDLTPLQFEEMMDRLEKSSGRTVVTLNEAKALLKEDDDLIIAVFDYWLNKRLKTQHPLLLTVKTEHRLGSAANNPYLAFRRRTEKMQTRKNRKNDETSYEKMLKLRRDLSRAVTLLELVKRREKTKREHLHLTIEVYEKRYQAQDFTGQILSEVSALKTARPAFAPLFTNQFGVHQNWANKVSSKDETLPRKEKRQYKKRKHKTEGGRSTGGLEDAGVRGGAASGLGSGRDNRTSGSGSVVGPGGVHGSGLDPLASSDDESSPIPSHSHSQPSLASDRDEEDNVDNEGQFAFRRNRNSSYLPPVSGGFGNWPWCDRSEGGLAEKKYRFALTSISKPTPRCIGLARRRLGRGGRVILDRCSNNMDDMWSNLDFTIHEPKAETLGDPTATATTTTAVKKEWLHFRPKTPPVSAHSPSDASSTSSDTDSDPEYTIPCGNPSRLRSRGPNDNESTYPFPAEATSICVDILEPDRPGEEQPPFTSEFNIADYFSVDAELNDFELGLAHASSASTLSASSSFIGGLGGLGLSSPTKLTAANCSASSFSSSSPGIGCSRFNVTRSSPNIFAAQQQKREDGAIASSGTTNSSVQQSVNNFSTSSSSISSSSSNTTTATTTTATTIGQSQSTGMQTIATSVTSLGTKIVDNPRNSVSQSSSLTSYDHSTGQTRSQTLTGSSLGNPRHVNQQQIMHQSQQLQRHLPNSNSSSSSNNNNNVSSPVVAAASILSKSLTSPSNNNNNNNNSNRSGLSSCSSSSSSSPSTSSSSGIAASSSAGLRVFASSSSISGLTNFGNGHQNGPTTNQLHHQNSPNSHSYVNQSVLQHNSGNSLLSGGGLGVVGGSVNSMGGNVVGGSIGNNQTIIIAQKHPPSSMLPGLIAQNKLAHLARQQQQAQQIQLQQTASQVQVSSQTQQIPASGEITLNSNSEGLNMMEVDGVVEGSPCDSGKQQQQTSQQQQQTSQQQQQQQQLVRANKTNSLAMEVT